jgi:hypothetical protein
MGMDGLAMELAARAGMATGRSKLWLVGSLAAYCLIPLKN